MNKNVRKQISNAIALVAIFASFQHAVAEPLAAPGDTLLRHDLQLLNDNGIIDIPLNAWPLPIGDIENALYNLDARATNASVISALKRVRRYVAWELEIDSVRYRAGLSASENPQVIRGFENTPRDEGQALLGLSWLGERIAVNLAATYASNPFDGDEFRPDGTYIGVVLGNWIVSAGWQDRWWGPSRDGSLILSTNARPSPGISIQRNVSSPFKSKFLSWIGPWTFVTFMNELDDDRFVNNARLFGIRGSFRPPKTGLEIGIARAAQWCGDGRPCGLGTFSDLLIGNDNRGVNVAPEDEPGNQLGGFDIRWTLPKQIPLAVYMQWIGEDGRGGGGAIGAWLRQLGVEHWGTLGSLKHRTHIEISDSMCREGGFGFSDARPTCAYNHSVYRTGYRYRGRAIGHPADSDSLSYSIGSTLLQSAGHSWNITLRYMEINRQGPPDLLHSLTPTPQELFDLQVTHQRRTYYGRFHFGVGYGRIDDQLSNGSTSDVTGFIQWSSQ